jgi:predicted cupin superfamily sugar epimerase
MKTKQTAEYWKDRFKMTEHPEGGFYHEYYRSNLTTKVPWSGIRNFSTAIVYMLENENKSAFHKIRSDELWHLYDGNANILIHILSPDGKYECLKLGTGEDALPCHVVPAGVWFAAELEDKNECYALAGCTVSPGFDFLDFEIANPEVLLKQWPDCKEIIKKF